MRPSYTIVGTDEPNVLLVIALDAPVHMYGAGGDDTLISDSGDDALFGDACTDIGYAGDGLDDCISIEGPTLDHATTGCETSTP